MSLFRFSADRGDHDHDDGTLDFEVFPSQRSCSYKLDLRDVGRRLKCECIVTDVFGRSSEPVSAISSPILPGLT